MATIITKNSGTASSVPTGAQLTAGELAVNTADKRLFTKNGGGTVVELGTNPSSLTLSNGTANGVPYLNASKVLTSGSALTFDGTTLNTSAGTPIIKATASTTNALYGLEFNGGALDAFVKAQPNNSELRIASGRSAGWGGFTSFYIDTTEQMRLTSTGLGIGTSSPARKLDVNGAANILNFAAFNTGATQLYVGRASDLVTGGWASNDFAVQTAGNILLASGGAAPTVVLNSYGNLGLGVTPSAWWSGLKALQINSVGAISASTGAVDLSNNYYYNGTNNVYLTTGYASLYSQTSGQHIWKTAPSGTAGNAITFTQAMTLDASGTLAVGQRIKSTGNAAPASGSGPELFWDGATGGVLSYNRTSSTYLPLGFDGSDIRFYTTSGERARIDSSGKWFLGNTGGGLSNSNSMSLQAPDGYGIFNHVSGTASTTRYVYFGYGGSEIGSISQNGTTAVAYNTASDYRLKENVQPMTGALAKVAALKPVTYTWKADGSEGEGFIAHELAEVCPQAVTGEKDAVDAEGNPQYQGIDVSFLVGTLTAAIQELKASLDEVKLEFDAYKAAHP